MNERIHGQTSVTGAEPRGIRGEPPGRKPSGDSRFLRRAKASRFSHRRALSLLEVVISTFIVGVMLVAAMKCVGSASQAQLHNGDRSRADLLAADLMAEILEQNYQEPDESAEFGRESSESGGSRADWDDVDDYDGWGARPPVDKDGNPLPNLTDWERTVKVDYVNPDNLKEVVASDLSVKRIIVKVSWKQNVMASQIMIVTDAWKGPPFDE